MKKNAYTIVRVILGIALLIFGLDKFLAFVPHNHTMTEEMIAAYHGLMANKFIMPSVGVVEVLSGALLIIGRYTLVALGAMIPIVFGILGFHLAVDVGGILPGLAIAAMLFYLIFSKRSVIIEFMRKADAA